MKLYTTVKALKKNVMTTLTSVDVISHEANLNKRDSKRRKFINAFKHTTGLVDLKVTQYTKNTEHPPIATLAEIIMNLGHNSSLKLLDLSHNSIDEITIQALSDLLYVQKMPLEFLFLDYLNNIEQVNLTVLVDTLKNHATLQTLSLQGNDLTHQTCQSIVRLLNSRTNHLRKILLTRCNFDVTDLEAIQQAALNKGKRFILEITNVNTTETQVQINKKSKSSSFIIHKTLNLPTTPTCLSKSDSNFSCKDNFTALFPILTPLPKDVGPQFLIPNEQVKSLGRCATLRP